MKSLPLLFAVALLASPVALAEPGNGAARDGDALARVQRSGVLRWGGDVQGGEPYVFVDPQNAQKLVGFEVEIADALGRAMGVRAEFAQNAWSTLEPSLARGDFDVILNGLEDTAPRRAALALSRPYYRYAERLTVRRGSPALGLDDVAGKRVATLASSRAHELLLAHNADVKLYDGVEEPYMDLVAQRVDAVLLDDVIADRYGTGHAELVEVGGDVAVGGYVIAMKRSEPQLAAAIDTALEHVRASGELERILRRWHLWNERQLVAPPAEVTAPRDAIAKTGAPLASTPPTPVSDDGITSHATGRLGGEWPLFLRGALMTALVSVAAMALAVPLGLLLAVCRIYGGRSISFAATAYVELLRGTPVLLQLYLLYYGLSSVVRLGALPAAILGLGLNYAAYEAEVYRAALSAIPRGQTEAALALGLSPTQTLRHILLPQALRLALPAVTNDFVALLKDSSLVSVISVVELTKQMTITAVDVRSWIWPGLACAALYFAMSWPLSRAAGILERRIGGAT